MEDEKEVKSKKVSWADEVELEFGLPPQTEVIKNGFKYVTEYKYNEENKKTKVERTYKILKEVVPKAVAMRRQWAKFGDAKHDKPGPSSHTTKVLDEIEMQFFKPNEIEKRSRDQMQKKLCNLAKCRICSGEHWSVNCPYKTNPFDLQGLEKQLPATDGKESVDAGDGAAAKYVPPFMRNMANGDCGFKYNQLTSIRITNLAGSTTESDIADLVANIGRIIKIVVPRDKRTGNCRGYAFVRFKYRKDAAAAIELLDGHGYDHLILNAEWSKQPGGEHSNSNRM